MACGNTVLGRPDNKVRMPVGNKVSEAVAVNNRRAAAAVSTSNSLERRPELKVRLIILRNILQKKWLQDVAFSRKINSWRDLANPIYIIERS